jgi:hypothetical protein
MMGSSCTRLERHGATRLARIEVAA